MVKDVKRQTRSSRSPAEWAVEALIYSRGTVAQLRDLPLDDGDRYPGYNDRWGYRKDNVPVALNGSISVDGTWGNAWIPGHDIFFEGFAGVAPAANWAATINQFIIYMSGRVADDDASKIVTDTEVSVASAAGITSTTPANRARKYRNIGLSNANRIPRVELTITPDEGTAAFYDLGNGVITAWNNALGGDAVAIQAPIWTQAGDTILIEDGNFNAFDVMRHQFLFEEYIV